MKLTLAYGSGTCLAFRGSLEFGTARQDPRGLTGSEYGFLRIAEELAAMGHDVFAHTVTSEAPGEHRGVKLRAIDAPIEPCDAMISLNEPDALRVAPAGAFRVALYWVNDLTGVRTGIGDVVDLWCSPSAPHLEQFRTNPAWHRVQVSPTHPDGAETFRFDDSKWCVIPLGCDPEKLRAEYCCDDTLCSNAEKIEREWSKIPGKVIYSSSPDRGLHWLLQEWPAIKAAVPHATLNIFYRLGPWLRGFDQTPHYPPIEPLRYCANYIEECLRRYQERGGMGITVRDSVSRDVIEKEMANAEVFAYPMQTTTWSEGFSCSTLEACAARACPVTTDCDAFGGVYGETLPLVHIEDGWVATWRDQVIRALTDKDFRDGVNEKARAFAEKLTWRKTAERIVAEIEERRGNQ